MGVGGQIKFYLYTKPEGGQKKCHPEVGGGHKKVSLVVTIP